MIQNIFSGLTLCTNTCQKDIHMNNTFSRWVTYRAGTRRGGADCSTSSSESLVESEWSINGTLSPGKANSEFSPSGGITTVGLPALALESSSGTVNDTSDGGSAVGGAVRSILVCNLTSDSSATSTDIVREWPRCLAGVNEDWIRRACPGTPRLGSCDLQ